MPEFRMWDSIPYNERWNRYLMEKNSILKKLGKRQILEWSCDGLPTLNEIPDPYAVLITNQRPSYVFDQRTKVFFLPERSWYGSFYSADSCNYMDVAVIKKYNCLINRLDVHRQAFFYELIRANLLDDGWVSMLCDIRFSNTDKKVAWIQMHQACNQCFDDLLPTVLEILPFRNFDPNKDIREIVASSAYSVVLETTLNRPDSVSFTEKTMRALQLPRPFLLMCSTGSVQRLRHLGFDVFDKFVDHSYDMLDTSTNAMSRLIQIFDELQRVCKEPVTPSMVEEWKKICQHNTEIIKSMNQNFDENLAVIDQAFDYVMEQS